MQTLSHHEITMMLLSLGVLLAAARTLGEIAKWLHQPSVVGEILAGILLGPTVLGRLAPDWSGMLFPASGNTAIALDGLGTLSITLFLLVAGIEVDLSTVWRQGTSALKVGLAGMLVPFAIGFVAAWYVPAAMGAHREADRWIFALFFATALSISALPVIAKTLLDLNLYRTDLGMIVISAAALNDLIGWIIFAMVLGMMGASGGQGSSVLATVVLTLCFATFMLTLGRWLVHRSLPWIQAYTHWPGGVISFCMVLTLFCAAFTEWAGIHAIFGAFIAGVAIGDSAHLRERTRNTIDHFVSFIFAPLFFARIGLQVNFAEHFEWTLVLSIMAIACAGKLLGCALGARWANLSRTDGKAIAFSMNARGAMEIILGLLALQAGVIRTRLFVALVIMALVTSMLSGPLVQWTLGSGKRRKTGDFLHARRFLQHMPAVNRQEAIHQLVELAAMGLAIPAEELEEAVLAREAAMHTGIGQGIAVPHARIPNLSAPVVAVGVSDAGVDFDSPDGELAHIIFLILTPAGDAVAQLDILTAISHTFREHATVERAMRAANFTEFLAALRN